MEESERARRVFSENPEMVKEAEQEAHKWRRSSPFLIPFVGVILGILGLALLLVFFNMDFSFGLLTVVLISLILHWSIIGLIIWFALIAIFFILGFFLIVMPEVAVHYFKWLMIGLIILSLFTLNIFFVIVIALLFALLWAILKEEM